MSTAAQFLPRAAAEHKAERLLAGWPEAAVLALIGHHIAPPFPIGSASLWHRHADSLGEKRMAECIASIIYAATDDDALARRVAVAAASHAAEHPPAPLRDLIEAAFGAALAAVDIERRGLTERVATIRQRRTRAKLTQIAAQRREAEAAARTFEREAAALRRDVERDRRYFERDPDNPSLSRLRLAWAALIERDVPQLERRAAALRAALPRYGLTPGQRQRLAEFSDRLNHLRAAARALRQARRDLGRVKPSVCNAA
jgi:hypothetical protein